MSATPLPDDDDPRAQLYHAIAAAYYASQALLKAEARYGKDSPEAAAARDHLEQVRADLIERERAYLLSSLQPSPRRRRNRKARSDSTAV